MASQSIDSGSSQGKYSNMKVYLACARVLGPEGASDQEDVMILTTQCITPIGYFVQMVMWIVSDIPLEAMHCGKYTASSLGLIKVIHAWKLEHKYVNDYFVDPK